MLDEWARSSRVRKLTHWVLWYAYKLLWGMGSVEGLEHLPASGPVIVGGGPHTSNFDIIMAVGAGPKRVVRGLMKREAFEVPVLGWLMREVQAIPLDRKGGIAGLRAALEALERGECVGIYPEGTRSKTGKPGRAKAGLGFIASRSQVPVVPVRIFGMWKFPFTRSAGIRFGPPIPPPSADADLEACQAYSQAVLERALSL